MKHPSSRIAAVDGLRALAVFGVIWAHIWSFGCDTPVWSIGKIGSFNIDINRAISAIGTGVDLFFVISGFCMYLMYAGKQERFDWGAYALFLKKRWLRIAPAFYVSAIVAAGIVTYLTGSFPLVSLLSHFTFTQIWLGLENLASPFWSLATEWHFYLVLPLFIWLSNRRLGFWRTVLASICFGLGFRLFVYTSPSNIENFWAHQLPTRLIEFVWGICVARLYLKDVKLPRWLQHEWGLAIGAIVAYIGRLLMLSEVVKLAGSSGFICKVFSEPILSLGYGLMLWNAIASTSIFQRFFSHPILQQLGVYSYSLYLWHWYPSIWIGRWSIASFGRTVLAQNIALGLSLAILIPWSALSYRYLEAPYFKNRLRGT